MLWQPRRLKTLVFARLVSSECLVHCYIVGVITRRGTLNRRGDYGHHKSHEPERGRQRTTTSHVPSRRPHASSVTSTALGKDGESRLSTRLRTLTILASVDNGAGNGVSERPVHASTADGPVVQTAIFHAAAPLPARRLSATASSPTAPYSSRA